MGSGPSRYVTASDLADYAYCPRSYWYRYHPPPEGPTPASVRSAAQGEVAHRRQLGAERRRATGGAVYWILLAVGLLAILGGLLGWH
jgi:CRISPR/Cas system-associated exonuclease Cas4 (RecB family)